MKPSVLALAIRIGALVAAIARPSVSADPDLARIEADYGKSSIVAFAGNGGLTIGLDLVGRIAMCRWPSPSFYDHVWSDGTETQGIVFGVEVEGEVIWATDKRWKIVTEYSQPGASVLISQGSLDGSEIRFREFVTVHPNSDAMVVRFEIIGAPSPPTLHVWANFSPCTRKLPELPLATVRREALMDFAAFIDPKAQRSYHFRPFHPNAAKWRHAERLRDESASVGERSSFREGVWISSGASQSSLLIVDSPVPSNLIALEAASEEDGDGFVTGDTYSHFRIRMEPSASAYTATWAAAFAGDYRSATDGLNKVLAESAATVEKLRVDSDDELSAALRQRFNGPGDEERNLLARAFLTLAGLRDKRSGSVVRGPSALPPLARDWPRFGAWIALAFDAAGRPDWTEELLKFYIQRVRDSDLPGKPAGSIPSALYADGTPATPEVELDLEAVGLMLWAVGRYASASAPDRDPDFLDAVWPRLLRAADFLAAWADPRTGRPWHAIEPGLDHDSRSRRHVVAAYMGLEAAIGIAQSRSEAPPPGWLRQFARLEARLLGMWKDGEPTIEIGDLFPFILVDVPSFGGVARFQGNERTRIEALPKLDGVDAARTLCELAFLYRSDQKRIESLRPSVLPVLRAALATTNDNNPPDALAAAYALVAAQLLYGAG
ncbi:MAG: hypothetical protein AAB353_07895 [Candidatus Hydrogenedentota bacterium]